MLQTNNETYVFTDNRCVYCSSDCIATKYLQQDVVIIDFDQLQRCYEGSSIAELLSNRPEALSVCVVPCKPSAIAVVQECGYYLVSTQVVVQYDYTTTSDEFCLDTDYTIFDQDTFKGQLQEHRFNDFVQELASLSHYGKDDAITSEQVISLYTFKINNALQSADTRIFWAVDLAGVVAGFIALIEKRDQLMVDLLAVHPNVRRKGVAQELLKRACLYAQEVGKDIIAHIQAENIASVRLYEKAGFLQKSFNLMYHKVRK